MAVRTDVRPCSAAPVPLAVRAQVSELSLAIRGDKYGKTAGYRWRIPRLAHASKRDGCNGNTLWYRVNRNPDKTDRAVPADMYLVSTSSALVGCNPKCNLTARVTNLLELRCHPRLSFTFNDICWLTAER